jgi:hypothetical protein
LRRSSADQPGPEPTANFDAVTSTAGFIRTIVDVVQHSFFLPVAILVAVLIFRVIFRRPWLAYAILWESEPGIVPGRSVLVTVRRTDAVVCADSRRPDSPWPLRIPGHDHLFVLVHLPSHHQLLIVVLHESIVTLVLFAAIAGYGFWVSLGGQKVVSDSLRSDLLDCDAGHGNDTTDKNEHQ